MKKIKNIIIICIIAILIFSNYYVVKAKTITLEEVVDTFNNCKTTKELNSYGSSISAEKNNNSIIIKNGELKEITFALNDRILSSAIKKSEFETDPTLAIMTMILIDCVEQLNGYNDGECFNTMNSEEFKNYTVENEGVEIKEDANGNYLIKIDLDKKMPLVETSSYFTVEDLEEVKDFISGDGSSQMNKTNIVYHKSGYNGENTIVFIGETENALTQNAYKSLLSILEVMFGNKEVPNYFSNTYKSFTDFNKEFDGFKVEINPSKTDMEDTVLGSVYNTFVRVTIDKDKAIEAAKNYKTQNENIIELNNEVNNNNVNNDNVLNPTNNNTTKIPYAGQNINYILIVLYLIVALSFLSIAILGITNKKNNN